MNLYEMTAELAKLNDILTADDVPPELAAQAEALQAEILQGLVPAKVEGYCHVIRRLEQEAAATRDEEKRLAERRRVRENAAARLKARLLDALTVADVRKVEAGTWTVTRAKGAPVLVTAEDAVIPDKYYRPQPAVLDRAALLAGVKAGEGYPGVTTETRDSLRLK